MLTTLLLSLLPVAIPAQADLPYAEVASDDVSLHAFYDSKAAKVLEVEKGLPVKVVTELAPWSKVRVPGGLDVWVHKDYVEWKGGIGHITGRRVRIRPMPSTDASSTPLGHFQKDDEVQYLNQDGDWFQVRAPETVSAWILTEHLATHTRGKEAWETLWNEAASKRPVDPKVVQETDEPEGPAGVEPADVDPETVTEVVESAEGSEVAVEAEAAAPVLERMPLFRGVDVAKDPEAMRRKASERLEQLGSEVTRDSAAWDRRRLDNLEMVFGNVIWHSTNLESIEAARGSLTRIDGLRRFYYSRLAADIRRALAADDKETASKLEAQLAKEKKPVVEDGEGTSVAIGWVEYKPSVHANMPFRLSRGGSELPMHSFDGHQDLKEFVGREIVVRGVWREEKKLQAGRVLAITELRVLPARGQ
ncbi:MAG: SH3 domain-containing protein [Planctomycetota bacterium]